MSDSVEYQYRIELLTNELERSSQALQQKNLECEQYRLQSLNLEQKQMEMHSHYEILDQSYNELSEKLRLKFIENDDLKSKYNRLTSIKIKEYEDNIEKLLREQERINQLLHQKGVECDSNRLQILEKIQELQEERQNGFHLDNFIKQIKTEKLEALHFLNEKTKELDNIKERFKEADQYRVKAQSLELDIESIRSNYTSLFTQHLEEIQKLRAQIDTLRQVNENNMVIAENKYVTLLEQEKQNYQRELKEKIATSIVQMENQIGQLNNLLEAKQNEIEKLKVQKYNFETEKTNSILVTRNSQMQEMTTKLIQLERQLFEKQNALDQIQGQVQSGQLIPATSQSLLERSYKQVQEDIHIQNIEMARIQTRCLELQDEVSQKAIQKAHYEGQINTLLIEIAALKRDMRDTKSSKKESELQAKLLLQEKEIQRLRSDNRESDQKIAYLLKQLSDQQKRGGGQSLQENSQQLLQAIMEESDSRIFYHEEDSSRGY
ncbi:hypothetical protein pb186bvf_012572 [Paramecium bursaria]